MKSQHEPFDEELRDRLQHYTEEPDEDYWQGIASNIVSVNSEPRWIVWPKRLSVVLFGLAVLLVSYRTSLVGTDYLNPIASLSPLQAVERVSEQQENFLSGKAEEESLTNMTVIEREVTGQKTGIDVNLATQKVKGNDETILRSELLVSSASQMNPDSLPATRPTHISQPAGIEKDTAKIAAQILTQSNAAEKIDEQKKKQRHRKYTLYFTAMPTLGYQRIESNQTDKLIIESIDRIPAFSTKRLGVRVELGIEYPVTPKIRVFGGFLYYQRKQTIGYTEKHLDSTLMTPGPTGGEIIVEPQYSYLSKSVEYELKNVGIQIGLNYTLSRKKAPGFSSKDAISSKRIPIPKKTFSHMIGTGFEFHKALNKTNEFDQANGFSNPSAYVFYNIYYRLQYPSEGKLRAIFQPTLNYSFYFNEDLHTPFYVKPYGLGLNFGCVYNF